jgi:hypothetical protein
MGFIVFSTLLGILPDKYPILILSHKHRPHVNFSIGLSLHTTKRLWCHLGLQQTLSTECSTHRLLAVLILPVGESANNSFSVVIFMKNAYLDELLKTCILYVFSTSYYHSILSTRSGGVSTHIK